jgi:hypothetical protein
MFVSVRRSSEGEWTDDTAMMLALGESLVARRGLDARDLMSRFVNWWRWGQYSCTGTCFDIGMTTARALARFEGTGEPYAGSTDPQEAGNGSLMRVAPVALFALHDADLAISPARCTGLRPFRRAGWTGSPGGRGSRRWPTSCWPPGSRDLPRRAHPSGRRLRHVRRALARPDVGR